MSSYAKDLAAVCILGLLVLAVAVAVGFAIYACAVDAGWLVIPIVGGPILFAAALGWAVTHVTRGAA
jgi:hypothetical protein